ncbi:MAG: energy-coupling factor ABC transporter permease [Candidatus Margulisbacteria bacterium]|nr:energy-coupling factor ABC transporter permease [Candidatus Margulisiibacteriota bacterium]MBU1021687.1 energy-coupling factor ABC transporter permease [Candidatus Margulisiibacteriota bacterium]MBU1729565.1 energy-coupling factor ABC transporter permease [Candidatus Margulisiibacteriota bacterium]MBU1955051.1 energy-coupling factor ABC transporter permease [Candidatus Margulisiibacteriota bacterium]
MHIPNGFVDPKISTGLAFAAAGALAYCLNKVKQAVTAPALQQALAGAGEKVTTITSKARKVLTQNGRQTIEKIGLMAGLIFAAQMFNFPIASGTSGHLIGGALAVIVLGPAAGTLAVALVVIIQSLFFADGGILILGGNIVNMAVIGGLLTYYIYVWLKKLTKSFVVSAALAAWCSVMLAATATSVEIGLSGTFALSAVLPAMLKTHAVIGVAEGFITVALLGILRNVKFYNNEEKI